MKNLIEYVKDKSYYFLGATVLIIIIAVAVTSCSSGGSSNYEQIENNMINAAKKYYDKKTDLLPVNEGEQKRVNIATLVEAELLKEVYDPKNKSNKCTGYVDVIKIPDNYSYIPFLKCEGNYEPEYLSDKIKNSELDEYGNGVYEMNGEYVFRGDDVNNYITFNNQLWRIIKVDKDGDIELVFAEENNKNRTSWDTAYNSEIGRNYGITTDYLHTDMRKSLHAFYNNVLDDDSRSKIVLKNICVGSKQYDAKEDENEECSVVKENEYVSLLRVSDYAKISLDSGCTIYSAPECTNRNYLAISGIESWLLTRVADTSYEVYNLNGMISYDKASKVKKISPVVYLSKNVIVSDGKGSKEEPYKLK